MQPYRNTIHPNNQAGSDRNWSRRTTGDLVKSGPDKAELRIHRGSYGFPQWSLASPAPGTAAEFRRWNMVLIAILVFLVLGVFVVAEAPRTANDTNASLKENPSPVPLQHANSSKGALPPIHSRAGSGILNKEMTGGHHAADLLASTPTKNGFAGRTSLRMNLCARSSVGQSVCLLSLAARKINNLAA